ncbi:uncharacterized protein HKW66_Vig0081160 [Vigna angularis]|uniref:Uncharacterized protein n=1 Tax=Phaseolus angularis TaxID=3914 RepID=A0A8T0KK33_PHAAN|nr:uncharacterized protein HKW66_Vig0081160 [Vigna angularis]
MYKKMGLESTHLPSKVNKLPYIYLVPKVNQFSSKLGLIPIFLVSQPHTTTFSLFLTTPDYFSPPHEPAGDSCRRTPAFQERGSAPGASPAASQSQERIAQDQEAATAPRRPPPLPRTTGAESAPTGTSDNLLGLPKGHPRQARRLHGRRAAPYRSRLRRGPTGQSGGCVASREAGID